MAEDKGSLSRLTLRQLRNKAKELGVPLYSRKSKDALVNEIDLYNQQHETDSKLLISQEEQASSISSNPSSIIETRVVFLPRDPEWAYVFWEISDDDRNRALAQGANRLCLRLSDVTGFDEGSANPGILREFTVDSHSTEWYLPIPIGGRDYRVEMGYRSAGKWVSLGISSPGKAPSMHPSEQILDEFVPFSLQSNVEVEEDISTPTTVLSEVKDTKLHERLYESATTHLRTVRTGSEEFQEASFSSANNQDHTDSGAGLWLSGLNDSGLGGVVLRQRSFWLVADAELIIYGSTDPSAKLTIGKEEVPLAADGTFRLQVPFRDGSQNYLIEATDAEGIQKRNITMNFQRVTPEDNTNPSNPADKEWF